MNESCQKFPIREVIFRLLDQYNPGDLKIEDQIDDDSHDPDNYFPEHPLVPQIVDSLEFICSFYRDGNCPLVATRLQ